MDTSIYNLKLEILVATMNRTSLSFLEKMFPHHNLEALHILIINQTVKGKELSSHLQNTRVINAYETGLSKSRNLAIDNAIGDICLIADDDVEYLPNFENVIVASFGGVNHKSVALFKIKTFKGEAYKGYPNVSKKLTKRKDIAKASSIEIAFVRADIIKKNIRFNTLYGLGSQFPSGEEYLFLKEVLNNNLSIYFDDKYIVKHKKESSTMNVTDGDFLKTKGAIYYMDYKNLAFLYAAKYVFFLLRNDTIRAKNIKSTYSKIIKGVKDYKEMI